MSDTIYCCGWCGWPVAAGGDALTFINDPDEATAYLKKHAAAKVVQVNGYCCPEGDGELRPSVEGGDND